MDEKQLREAVYRDDLTGLSNRRSFRQVLPEELKQAKSAEIPLSLLVLDVDYFKDVNDTRGHQAGDKALSEMAELLRGSLRETDAVFRYAGDEFAIILPDTDNQGAIEVGQKLAERVSDRALDVLGKPVKLTISVGVATYPEDGDNLFALFDIADRAMYARKRRGRDGVCSRAEVAEDVDVLRPVFCPELVGRKEELSKLKDLFRQSVKGKGSLVFVSGEAGIGKTRLLDEFSQAARRRGAHILSGRCFGEPTCLPYQPFKDALSKYAEGRGKQKKRNVLKSVPDAYRNELLGLIPELTELGIKKGSVVELKPDQAKLRLFDAMRQLFQRISDEKPLMVVLDDLHLADESSSQLLHYLARNLRESPVLICGAFRGEELEIAKDGKKPIADAMQSMTREDLFSSIPLKRLTEKETSRMISLILSTDCVPRAFSERMYKETEGNPFFVEEVLKSLIQSGKVSAEQDLAKVDLDALEIPVAIRDVVQRRLDMLHSDTVKVLTYASVLGERFRFDVLREMSEFNEGHLLDLLDQALRSQLITEQEKDTYHFSHGKISETIYDGIARRKRKQLHRAAGESLEKALGEKAEGFASDLSHHFYLGEEWRKAFDYSYKAAERAKEVYANEDAIAIYQRALDAFGKLSPAQQREFSDTVIALHYALGDVFQLIGEYHAAMRSYEKMLDIAKGEDKKEEQGKGLRGIGRARELTASYDEALRYYEESLAICRDRGDDRGIGHSLRSIGNVHWHRGSYDDSLRYYEESLAIFRDRDDERGIGDSLRSIGIVHYGRGFYGDALRYYEESLAICREIGDKQGIGLSLREIGNVHWQRDSYDDSLRYYEESLAIFREIGDKRGIAVGLNSIGNVHRCRGVYDEALRYLEESLAIDRETGDKNGIGESLGNIGVVHVEKGSYDDALRCLEESLSIHRETSNKRGIGNSLSSIGIAHWHRGSYDVALRYYEQSLAIDREIGSKSGIGCNLGNIGNVHCDRGSYDVALRYYEECLSTFKEIGDRRSVGSVLHNIGDVHCFRGFYDDALGYYEQSLAIRREIGDKNGIGYGLSSIGNIHCNRGSYDVALRYHEQSLAIRRELGDKSGIGNSLSSIANVHCETGAYDEAQRYCEESLATAAEIDDAWAKAAALDLLAEIHIGLGQREEAKAAIEELLGIAEATESRMRQRVALQLNARLLCPSEEALPYAEKALELAEEMKTPESVWQAHRIIGRVLKEKGDLTEAKKHYKKAKDIVESIASNISDPKIRKTYLSKREHKELFAELAKLKTPAKRKRKKKS